jgi:hypothetical protein
MGDLVGRSDGHVTQDVKWGNDLVSSVGGTLFAGLAKDAEEALRRRDRGE